jgi:hypothetical protein
MQFPQLFGEPLAAARVELIDQPTQKLSIGFAVGKIAVATQHQGLIQCTLEAMMTLLDIAVFVAVIRLGLLADQPVMIQQSLIAAGEFGLVRQVVDRRAQSIRTMPLRHTAQIVQGVLQAFAEAFETLRKTDRHRLPI